MNRQPTTSNQQPGRRGAFTLIELLVVVTIIGILAGIVLGVSGLVIQKGDRARAIADMEKIKNALEEHRIEYGNYPISETANDSASWMTNLWVKPIADGKRPFLTTKFLTNSTTAAAFLDPWGNDYRYLHRRGPPFNQYADQNNSKFGYDLWSLGPNSVSNADDITNWRGDF
ncbi:MAG: type II secretion system protein GspG [bacterium]